MSANPPTTLQQAIPDADTLLDLEPEELGLVILRVLNGRTAETHHGGNFSIEFRRGEGSGYPDAKADLIQRAVLEAWAWLDGQALIAPAPGMSGSDGWVFVTRRGRRIVDESTAAEYMQASAMPWHLVHATVAEASRAEFLRGDYETAVFKAFKAVEVAVRVAGSYPDEEIGVNLMRKAFGPGGPLTDSGLPESEQQSLAHLAAGAIGSYKNPHSHRTVALRDPLDATEMLFLASHLLRIVDARPPG